MPTVMRIDGLRVVVYPNDHRPARVHVMGAGCEAVFSLNCPNGTVTLVENFGFRPARLRVIEVALMSSLQSLCKAWREVHGHDSTP